MWRLLPKVPAALLLVIVGLWSAGHLHDREGQAIIRVSMLSPPIPLHEGSEGAWDLLWPEWPERKGPPVVTVVGVTVPQRDRAVPFELRLRVAPRDAVRLGKARHMDEEGWFEAGTRTDWDTLAQLDRSRVQRVEYVVRRAEGNGGQEARLRIDGWNDPSIEEAIVRGGFARSLFSLLFGVPLVLWTLGAFFSRWIDQLRAARTEMPAPADS